MSTTRSRNYSERQSNARELFKIKVAVREADMGPNIQLVGNLWGYIIYWFYGDFIDLLTYTPHVNTGMREDFGANIGSTGRRRRLIRPAKAKQIRRNYF